MLFTISNESLLTSIWPFHTHCFHDFTRTLSSPFASMCRRWLLLLSDSCIIIGRIYVYKVYAFAGPGRYCIELERLWIVTRCAHYMKIWNHPEIALYTFLMTFDWLISLVVFSVCDAALNDEQFIMFVGFNRLFATRCHVDCVWESWKAIFHVFHLRMVSLLMMQFFSQPRLSPQDWFWAAR